MSKHRIIIVGAGVAGLTAAFNLAKAGNEVIVLEVNSEVGGLARSFHYNGFSFDIGPHRFHTDNKEVEAFIKSVLKGRILAIKRKSGVWMFGKYFDWPLKIKELLRLPPKVIFEVFLDIFRHKNERGVDFESYIIAMYGKTIYRIFFEPYTRKFIGIAPQMLHSDWARAGIDRALIDKRVKIKSLKDLIYYSIIPKPIESTFLYPANGSIDQFVKNLSQLILENGGKILKGYCLERMEVFRDQIIGIKAGGEEFSTDYLIWTGPVSELEGLLGFPPENFKNLNLVLYNFLIAHPPLIPYQWSYYGGYDTRFVRISLPVNFNPENAPEGKCGICVEVSCRKEDEEWKNPQNLIEQIKDQLLLTNLIKDKRDIIDVRLEKISNTYPVYELDYKDKIKRFLERAHQITNLFLLGRTGTFWYNNMDHSILAAMILAERLKQEGEASRTMDYRWEYFVF